MFFGKGNRSHSKIASLPPELRQAVDEMLKAGTFRYEEVQQYLADNGVDVSQSSICRYARRLVESYREIITAQESFKALLAEAEKYPELDTTEVLTRIASHRMLSALVNKPDDEWDGIQADKLLKEISAMTRAVAYKERLAVQSQEETEAAMDAVQKALYKALADEKPELYRQLVSFLQAKKDVLPG